MTKIVKWIDNNGDIQTTEYNNDDPIKESNVIEISDKSPVWTTDKQLYKITYDYDECAVNPVTEYYAVNDVMVAIARDARNYNIGNYEYEDLCQDYGYDPDDGKTPDKLIRKLNKTGYANFISVYDHSGHDYFLGHGRGWDVSLIGLIYIPYETSKDGEKFARGLLDEVNAWVNGNCYSVMIDKLDTGEWDNVYSCCGYYDKKHCIESTKDELQYLIKDTDPIIITIDNTY